MFSCIHRETEPRLWYPLFSLKICKSTDNLNFEQGRVRLFTTSSSLLSIFDLILHVFIWHGGVTAVPLIKINIRVAKRMPSRNTHTLRIIYGPTQNFGQHSLVRLVWWFLTYDSVWLWYILVRQVLFAKVCVLKLRPLSTSQNRLQTLLILKMKCPKNLPWDWSIFLHTFITVCNVIACSLKVRCKSYPTWVFFVSWLFNYYAIVHLVAYTKFNIHWDWSFINNLWKICSILFIRKKVPAKMPNLCTLSRGGRFDLPWDLAIC